MSIISHFFLLFTRDYILITFLLLGCCSTKYKQVFLQTALLLLFTMIFSAYLKSIWQIPLLPHLNTVGWSFPSGHMQGAVAFWGCLAIQFRAYSIKSICLILIAGIGFGLVHLQYHIPKDIFASLGFAGLTLLSTFILLKFFSNKTERLGLLFCLLGLALISLYPRSAPHLPHLWMAEGGLLGCSVGLFLMPKQSSQATIHAILQFSIGILGVGLLYFLLHYLPQLDLNYKNFIHFFLIGLWISWGLDKLIHTWKKGSVPV